MDKKASRCFTVMALTSESLAFARFRFLRESDCEGRIHLEQFVNLNGVGEQ
jgi:hypothetical protein